MPSLHDTKGFIECTQFAHLKLREPTAEECKIIKRYGRCGKVTGVICGRVRKSRVEANPPPTGIVVPDDYTKESCFADMVFEQERQTYKDMPVPPYVGSFAIQDNRPAPDPGREILIAKDDKERYSVIYKDCSKEQMVFARDRSGEYVKVNTAGKVLTKFALMLLMCVPLFIGLGFIIATNSSLNGHPNHAGKAVQTVAVITSHDSEHISSNDPSSPGPGSEWVYWVHVKYSVDGKEIESTAFSPMYENNFKPVGTQLYVYYDPEEPSNVDLYKDVPYSKGFLVAGIVLISLSGAAWAIYAVNVVKKKNSSAE